MLSLCILKGRLLKENENTIQGRGRASSLVQARACKQGATLLGRLAARDLGKKQAFLASSKALGQVQWKSRGRQAGDLHSSEGLRGRVWNSSSKEGIHIHLWQLLNLCGTSSASGKSVSDRFCSSDLEHSDMVLFPLHSCYCLFNCSSWFPIAMDKSQSQVTGQ